MEKNKEIKVIDTSSPFWPQDLKCVTKLWCMGNLELLRKKSVSIVGTRKPSPKAIERTKEVVDCLGKEYVIVSGLAHGIDTISHVRALSQKCGTIAVIPTPIDQYYPKENMQLQNLIAQDNLVVSPFDIGTKTEKYCFMKRNQVMSQISCFSVVIEDPEGGGAVGQAKYTAKQNKSVVVFSDVYLDDTLTWPHKISTAVVVSKAEEIIKKITEEKKEEQPSLF